MDTIPVACPVRPDDFTGLPVEVLAHVKAVHSGGYVMAYGMDKVGPGSLVNLALDDGLADVAAWIEANAPRVAIAREVNARKDMDTPAGPLRVGSTVNLTVTSGYGEKKSRTLRDVRIGPNVHYRSVTVTKNARNTRVELADITAIEDAAS